MKVPAASLRTRAFVDALGVGAILFGAAVRLRLVAGSPLPPAKPAVWLLLGAAGDLAAFALAGAVCLGLCRLGPVESAVRALLSAAVVVQGLLLFLWTEAILYFGHAPRRQDFAVALDGRFIRNSTDAALTLRLAAALAVLALVVAGSATWSRRAGRAWSRELRLLPVGAAALALTLVPLRVHLAETARNPVAIVLSIAREAPAAPRVAFAARVRQPDEIAVRALARAAQPRYLSETFPLAAEPAPRSPAAPRVGPGVRPNIVFVVMEGVRSEEVGAYGGRIPDLTPNLDRLSREGVRIERVYSPGTHTPEGELALWYGLLAVPRALVMTHAPETPLYGLPEILRAAGWRDFLWIHNGDQTFFGRDRFYLPRGFQTTDGRDFDPSNPRTNWGYTDRALARRSVEAFDRLEPPFAAMMLTVTNHHPFNLPPDARDRPTIDAPEERGFLRFPGVNALVGRHTVPMLGTVHYTDEAVGEFFELARSRSWFAQTVFVVTGDHGLPIATLDGRMTPHRYEELRHRVPLLFYAPAWIPPGTRPGPASLADVSPTLLGLLGILSPRGGVGCDLLDPSGCDPTRPVVSWNDEAQTVTMAAGGLVYHRFSADGAAEEILAAPDADPLGERNLAESESAEAARFRGLSDVYLDVYPRVVLGGRSGVPTP